MASQAAIFAETIAGMKKAVKRKAYDSDSDSSIEHLTNRGNKLRKKARFVHEGQLAPPTGPLVYKKRIEHAGFQREIINRNPPLVDEDGYEVDSDDDDERAEAAMAAAAEFDPYSDIRLEHLLAPLTAASDLPDHPTLSKPFTAKTLTELTRQAGEMVQKERASLWKIKHLLTRLSGDSTWIPCEVVETGSDFALFNDERDRHRGKAIARDDGDHVSTGTLISDEAEQPRALLAAEVHAPDDMVDAAKKVVEEAVAEAEDTAMKMTMDERTNTDDAIKHQSGDTTGSVKPNEASESNSDKNGPDMATEEAPEAVQWSAMDVNGATKMENVEDRAQFPEGADGGDLEGGPDDQDDVPAPHRMRTRAQAQAASDNTTSSRTRSVSPDSISESFVHPYFLAPLSSHADRDVGLPSNEAEETRRLLQLYIQKQEEVCRGAEKVYNGLLKADRYRKMVMKWSKAEAHVGLNRDMSDGEDWYDKEEWGLDEDLKKGQDEEEEDAATTAKKTRTRRQ